jgi:hypothetical protein
MSTPDLTSFCSCAPRGSCTTTSTDQWYEQRSVHYAARHQARSYQLSEVLFSVIDDEQCRPLIARHVIFSTRLFVRFMFSVLTVTLIPAAPMATTKLDSSLPFCFFSKQSNFEYGPATRSHTYWSKKSRNVWLGFIHLPKFHTWYSYIMLTTRNGKNCPDGFVELVNNDDVTIYRHTWVLHLCLRETELTRKKHQGSRINKKEAPREHMLCYLLCWVDIHVSK